MRPPCEHPCSEGVPAVFGYGDPNADFHLIGDNPQRHGGTNTGIPFTGNGASERLLTALAEVDLLDVSRERPQGGELYMSYLHLCCQADGTDPSEATYLDFERFFDAELRAVSAHVLMPVGDRAIKHVLEHFSSLSLDGLIPASLHAEEVTGRGFIVVPIREPADWSDADERALIESLKALKASDYTQEADLTRFFPTNRQYLVR